MKTSIKTFAAAIALSALVAGPASAMISQGDLNRDILSVLGADSNVTVNVDQGTVTLQGYFGDASDQQRALQAAKNGVGVERVINHAFQTN